MPARMFELNTRVSCRDRLVLSRRFCQSPSPDGTSPAVTLSISESVIATGAAALWLLKEHGQLAIFHRLTQAASP